MQIEPTELPEVLRLRSPVHRDERGWVAECWRAEQLAAAGLPTSFAQENRSVSEPGVLRGLHFQERQPQGKLVTVLWGAVHDVVVDLRPGSPTRGRHVAVPLSAEPDGAGVDSLWVPPGFAHGFYVTAGPAVVLYKLTRPWAPTWDRCLAWDDPELAIAWPLVGAPRLSPRDRDGLSWQQVQALDLSHLALAAAEER